MIVLVVFAALIIKPSRNSAASWASSVTSGEISAIEAVALLTRSETQGNIFSKLLETHEMNSSLMDFERFCISFIV